MGVGGVAAALVAGVPVVAPGAAADPARPGDPTAPGPVVRLLSPAGVRDYWTPKRMREAVPLDLDPSGATVPASTPGTPAGRASAQATPGLRSTGKLFFRDGATAYVCSAAAVNTPERNLVVTAGHCVNSGGTRVLLGGCREGVDYSDFLFVPAYDQGARPYGTWVGTAAVTPSEWPQQCDAVARDQGMIRVAPLGGRNLVDVVGGNGLAWNYPAREDGVRVVGWPAQAPYDGESRQECTGSTTLLQQTGDAQIACPMTGGASGGPWLLRMASADTGFIFAVTSRRTTSGPALLLATPFDSSIEALLAAARTAARPVAARVDARPKKGRKQRVRLAASATTVGYGEAFQLVASTRRVRKVVLQVRTSRPGRWQRIGVVKVRGGGAVVDQAAAPGTRWYRIKVKKGQRRGKHSKPVAVTVLPCPLPLDRSPAVVSATRCTSPVG
ncbi:hypothetical protein GCM10009788_41560 [Nocardioides humi]|uniref:V8-like Glu-specific endopeptidase n=1 Tax=Nocardioides humi TaxID=449461 RepID=A0ABN2B5L4_9ACTN